MLTRSSLVRAAVTALTLAAGLTAGPARAEPGDRPWLFLSYNPEEPADRDPVGAIWDKDRHRVLPRPNVAEAVYLYVRNPTDKADYDLTVVLANGPDAADEFGRTANVRVCALQTMRVCLPKPAPIALPAGACATAAGEHAAAARPVPAPARRGRVALGRAAAGARPGAVAVRGRGGHVRGSVGPAAPAAVTLRDPAAATPARSPGRRPASASTSPRPGCRN